MIGNHFYGVLQKMLQESSHLRCIYPVDGS